MTKLQERETTPAPHHDTAPASPPCLLRSQAGGRRPRQRGAQSLEWLGLGAFVTTAMLGATEYARSHGGGIGRLLLGHLKSLLGQP